MRVEVLLFGPQAAIAGDRRVSLDVPLPASLGGVRGALAAACPGLAPTLPASRLSVNRRFAPDSTEVLPGDEIALIGMVSGG